MEMTPPPPIVIADSSALYALLSQTDAQHASAVAAARKLKQDQATIIMPTDVLSETINILGKRQGHRVAVEAIELMTTSSLFLIVSAEKAFPLAFEKFKLVAESVSFTDCLVMAMADSYETTQIFGFDGCFRKAGYHVPGRAKAA